VGILHRIFSFLFDRHERQEMRQQSTAGDLQLPLNMGRVGTWPGGRLTRATMIWQLTPSAWKERCWETALSPAAWEGQLGLRQDRLRPRECSVISC